LCTQSKEENWKLSIADLNLSGQHYLISQDQYNLLSEMFQIKGIPHYILIDKNGTIVDKNAPTPSETMVIKRIQELLN
jgi:hypothetical protein